ncbi:MAG: hypothetical protein RR328_07055 [Bacteroidales bacterium]
MQNKIYFILCLLAVSLLGFSSCASSRSSQANSADPCSFQPYQKSQAKPAQNTMRLAPGTPIGRHTR